MNLLFDTDKPIGLASDHAGFEIKNHIIDILKEQNVKYIDYGTFSLDSTDYPDYAHKLGNAIDNGDCDYGIAVCGSGNGINISLNRHRAVRSALCWNVEIARLARAHNNANVLALPGRFISKQEASDIFTTFFNTEFEGGKHQRRIDKINIRS